jgi:hypothetical protein
LLAIFLESLCSTVISFLISNSESSHRNNTQKYSVSLNYSPDQAQIQLSSLTVRAQTDRQTDRHFPLAQYYKNLDSGNSKLVPHNLLELQRGRVPHGTPLCRRVSYVWNAGFGILYIAVNYNQQPHRSMCNSTAWTKKIEIRKSTHKSYTPKFIIP